MSESEAAILDEIQACLKAVQPLFGPMVEQLRGDWTSTKDAENDRKQTIEDFAKWSQPDGRSRMSIGFLRLGPVPDEIQIAHVQGFIGASLCVEVRDVGQIETTEIAKKAWRTFGDYVPQVHAEAILDDVLLPRLDAQRDYGLIALTNEDLFCEMNDPLDYVYGLSKPLGSPRRAAIVSARRLWNPESVGHRLSTLRLFKLLTHEMGHMLGLAHCRMHACNMNGVETVDEVDRHPLEFCPHCMAKVCWVTQTPPVKRYRRLVDTAKKLCLAEAAFYERLLSVVSHATGANE